MKVEHLDTAARLSKKRKALKDLQDLLGAYVNCAEVKVTVEIGDKTKEASIKDDVFNALLYKLGALLFKEPTGYTTLESLPCGVYALYENRKYTDNPIQDGQSSLLIKTKEYKDHYGYILFTIQGTFQIWNKYSGGAWTQVL